MRSAIVRVETSVRPPAGEPLASVIGRDGYASRAFAARTRCDSAAAPSNMRRVGFTG